MKLSITYRITSLLLALLLFISSTGFSLDVHYCQDQFKSFSLVGEAQTCHEMAAKKSCHAVKKITTDSCKKDCCSNQLVEVEADTDSDKVPVTELTDLQITFLTAFVQSFYLPQAELAKLTIPHQNYVPPLLDRDIPVLIQSFLL